MPVIFKEKILALSVIFCIFLNGFIPRFSIESDDYELLSQIVASQSAILMNFFVLSSLPVKLVGEMLNEKCSAHASGIPSAPAKKKSNSANSSAEFSLINLDKKINIAKDHFRDGLGAASSVCPVYAPSSVLYDTLSRLKLFEAAGVQILCVILMFFFLLPRSSVSEDIAMSVQSYG